MDDDENIKMKMKTTSSSSSSSKKRKMKKQQQKLNTVFDAIDELESEDIKAASKRQKNTISNIQRANAAQSQTKIYNHLVECRILFQRAILNSTTSTTTSIKNDDEDGQDGTDDNNTRKQKLTDQCDSLIQKLLQARNQLVKNSTLNDNSTNDDDDDEKYKKLFAASYSDDDDDDDEEEEENDDNTNINKLDDILAKEYNDCRENWKQVLNRRHKDLKLHSGITAKSQFRVIDSSFWNQVEATVEYEQMRQDNSSNNNNNVFDDSKVYQQLLKDFVASSASAAAASGKGGSNDRLTAAKKSSSSTKKNDVDRRASKGRKIRYKEIPKLVNFTFPLSRPVAANSSALNQDEWFQSLFGGAASRNNPNKS